MVRVSPYSKTRALVLVRRAITKLQMFLSVFLDKFKFCGNVTEKHRQVGNAVPPALARALGVQLRKAHARSKAKANGKGKAIAKK